MSTNTHLVLVSPSRGENPLGPFPPALPFLIIGGYSANRRESIQDVFLLKPEGNHGVIHTVGTILHPGSRHIPALG